MSGTIKVIVSFFRKGEEVAIEYHRNRVPVDIKTHTGVFELKKKANRIFRTEKASPSVRNWRVFACQNRLRVNARTLQ